MTKPNRRQSEILHIALHSIAQESETNGDIDFANDLIDFINQHPMDGQGSMGHYGKIFKD
jgi:hypothetical protein